MMRLRMAVAGMCVALSVGAWAKVPAKATVPVVMLSDIHFDPFHDPGKVAKLDAAPVGEWEAILAFADSATQAADFAGLQKSCKAKGVDTPWVLLASSMKAEQARMAEPLFVTVSGDLMAHQFDCKYRTMVPGKTAADYSAFAAKTVAFVALEVHKTFPDAPVYFALGNNDSGCKDYEEDAGSNFLSKDAASFAKDAMETGNALAIVNQSMRLGDYSVVLPSPVKSTRLIVMQDIFESKKFTSCKGEDNDAWAAEQIAWLKAALAAARAAHEKVWVMAHIPPGVDAFSTMTHGRNVCEGGKPEMFLASEAMSDVIAEYGDVVKLALFGHTHMDEIKLIQGAGGKMVATKLVPSISPVDGNNPAFTVAEIEPGTATLKDYAVYSASNQTGVGTVWGLEYRYSATYGEPDFSAASVKALTDSFFADKTGSSAGSMAYEKFFFVGDPGVSANAKAMAMKIVWPTYTCSMTAMGAEAFKGCVCKSRE